MRTLYFPFTFVSSSALEALSACFQPIHVLVPSALEIPADMVRGEQDGRLVLDRRAAGDDAVMEQVLRQYHDWARVHRGSEMAWLKSQKDAVPFYDETSISRIRSELFGRDRDRPERDPLQEARIFLQMAQMYDAETSDLETDLESFEPLEKALFQDLRGESAAAGRSFADIGPPADPGAFMSGDRLKSWARLCLAEPPDPADPPPLMVTTSRAVLETVLEAIPDAEQVAFVDRIPLTVTPVDLGVQWRQDLSDYISGLSQPGAAAESPVPPDGGERAVSLSVYRISGMSADKMVQSWISPDSAPVPGTPDDAALLSLIDRPSF